MTSRSAWTIEEDAVSKLKREREEWERVKDVLNVRRVCIDYMAGYHFI